MRIVRTSATIALAIRAVSLRLGGGGAHQGSSDPNSGYVGGNQRNHDVSLSKWILAAHGHFNDENMQQGNVVSLSEREEVNQ